MIFNGNFDEEETWKEGETRESKLVFIGKNLDKEALKSGFETTAFALAGRQAKFGRARSRDSTIIHVCVDFLLSNVSFI